MYRLLPLLFVCFSISMTTFAQEGEHQQVPDQPAIQYKSSRVFGRVIDPATEKGIDAASIQLYLLPQDSLVDGMLTKSKGNFSVTNMVAGRRYRLLITALGYEKYEYIIDTQADGAAASGKFEKDLGNIELATEVKELEDIKIVATKPAMEMGIDRKVFNVSKSLNATGGSAVDLMRNIPSVSVDVDGNVQLRNTSPQIFVDGRPTILTLDQIPADNIEKIELITNPSAKFDAASGGGIINVVLKKDKRFGLNGIASASGGYPGIGSGNLNLNLREGMLNFFASGGYNQSGGVANGEAYRENKLQGVTQNYFDQITHNDRRRQFSFINFGMDYYLDNRNSVSITQTFGNSRFNGTEDQDQIYYTSTKQLDYYGYRNGDNSNRYNRSGTRVNFKRTFPQKGKELTADISYNQGRGRGNSQIENSYLNPDGSEYKASNTVRNEGNGNNRQITFQADYSNPIDENKKLEVGVRSFLNYNRSIFNVYSIEGSDQKILPLSNNYKYNEMINAVYGTYSQKMGNFSYQLGLRAEYSQFDGLLIDSAYKFGYKFPTGFKNLMNSFFPSLFLTQQLNETDQVQVNFSRRIRRPDFWQMNPYVEISDPFNIRQGNPEIQPEFINSFEVNYGKTYQQGNFLAVLYLRNNPKDITQYSDTISVEQYEKLQNAAVDPNAILNTFINAGTTNRWGAEFTVQHKVNENFDLTPSLNMQYRTVQAKVNNLDLSNQGVNWQGKLTASYKLKSTTTPLINNLSFQLVGDYESAQVIPQGKRLPQYGVDFAIRKEFLKNRRATATFSINDMLNSRRWGTIYDTETFYQDSYRRWNVRSFRLTVSYKFGKADFSILNLIRNKNSSSEEENS